MSEMVTQVATKYGHSREAAAVLMMSLVLVGCSEQPRDDTTPVTPNTSQPNLVTPSPKESPLSPTMTPSTSPTEVPSAQDCSLRYVTPGENFSEQNRQDIEEDIELITELYTSSRPVGLREIALAGRIVKDSLQDPLYSQAIVKARDSIADGNTVTVDSFLSIETDTPPECDANHIEKQAANAQLHQTVSIGQSLSRKIGSRLDDQASVIADSAYEAFKEIVSDIKESLDTP